MSDAPRILIVDDEPAIPRALELAFEETGWTVMAVASAEQALVKLREAPFSLYIIDKNLPGMSGIELVREVRKVDEAAGVLLVTGYASAASARDALNLGVDAYLEKPFADIFAVVRLVESTLAEAERRRTAPKRAAASDTALTILLASPSEKLRGLIAGHLDAQRDHVVAAASAAELLDAVSRGGVDLIILDGSGGVIDRVAELRARARDVACVVSADRLALSTVRRLIELEVRSFLDGAAEGPEYRARLLEVVERHRRRKQLRDLYGAGAAK
jgi:DNA-binding NtrC family response regulator